MLVCLTSGFYKVEGKLIMFAHQHFIMQAQVIFPCLNNNKHVEMCIALNYMFSAVVLPEHLQMAYFSGSHL